MDRSLRLQVILAALDRASRPLKSIATQSSATGRALKGAQDRKRALDQQLADVTAFNRLEGELVDSAMKARETRQRVDELRMALANTVGPTTRLASQLEAAKRASDRAEEAHGAQARELRTLQDRLEATGASTLDLSNHEDRLRREMAGTNEEIAEQRRRLSALNDQQRRNDRARGQYGQAQQRAGALAGAGAGTMVAGAVIAAPLINAGRESAALESDLVTIVQRSGEGRDAIRQMRAEIIALEGPTNQTRQELTAVMDTLTGRGMGRSDATLQLEEIGRTATAYGIEGAQLADAAYSSVNSLGIAANRTGASLEIMAAAGKAGSFEIADMAASFPSLTAQAASVGESGERGLASLSAAAQIVRRNTGTAEEAATNLQNVLQKVISPETERRFARVGINLREELARARAEGRDVYETIADLTNRATGGDQSLIGRFFADSQAQAGVRALVQHQGDYERIRDEALASRGAIDRDFAIRMQADAEQMQRLRTQGTQLADTMVQGVMPAFRAVRDFAIRAGDSINAWAEKNPELAKGLGQVVGVIAALLLAVGAVILAVSAVLMPFAAFRLALMLTGLRFAPLIAGIWGAITAMATWTAGMITTAVAALPGLVAALTGAIASTWAFTVALLANPITWVVLAVLALIAVVVLLVRNWDQVSAFFERLWTRVSEIFGRAVSDLVGWVTRLWSDIQARFSGAVEAVAGFAGRLWDRVREAFVNGVRAAGMVLLAFSPAGLLLAGFLRVWPMLAGFVAGFREAGGNLIDGLMDGLRRGADRVLGFVRNLASRIAGGFRNVLGIRSPSRVFMALGGHTMDGLQIGLERGARRPLDAVRTVAAGLVSALAVSAAAPAVAYEGLRPEPGSHAAGGPEHRLDRAPRLARPASSAPAAAAPASWTINIYPQAGQDPQDIARAVGEEIERRQREQSARDNSSHFDGED